jgi:hypothetical protein
MLDSQKSFAAFYSKEVSLAFGNLHQQYWGRLIG